MRRGKDGSMTSDNETANEDDGDDLDIPVRANKMSSKYSSKKYKAGLGGRPGGASS